MERKTPKKVGSSCVRFLDRQAGLCWGFESSLLVEGPNA